MKLDIKRYPIYIGIFIISLATLSIQIFLTRMFSLSYWYHFAFLIISIALFGIGFGGMLIFFLNYFFKKHVELFLYILSIVLAVSVVVCIYLTNTVPLETNFLADNPVHKAYFMKIFLILSIPFILSGMIFSLIFTNYSQQISKVYFADLVGGGIGCFAVLLIFPGKGPFLMSVITAVTILVAAIVFISLRYHIIIRAALAVIPIAMIIILMAKVYPAMSTVNVRVSESKRESIETYGPVIFSHWDNFSYVVVHEEKGGAWYRLFGDYATTTPIMNMQSRKPIDLLGVYKNHLYPFYIKPNPEEVCIVGAGGGKEVIMALAYGAKNIYALEFNPTFHWLTSNKFKAFSGNLVDRPGVNYIHGEGRYYIKASDKKYDAIIFNNAISQTAASSGAYSLSESYLYTVEAFMDYINHLKPDGVLSLSNPFSDLPRFVTVVREAFKRLGRENEFKYSVITSWVPKDDYQTGKLVVKNGRFTQKEINSITNYMAQYNHSPLYVPGRYYNSIESRLVLSEEIDKEYAISDNDIRPSTDNWPFFTQRVKPDTDQDDTKYLKKIKHFYAQPFVLIKSMLFEAAKICLLFLILPLLIFNFGGLRKLKNKVGSIVYFMALGMGFMLVEVIFMQKFILFLGHPIYSFSVVLSALMISSGIGSLFTSKLEDKPYKAIRIAIIGIIGSIALNMLFFHFLSETLISYSFAFRVFISVLLVGMSGFFMGFLMPIGIKIISSYTQYAIPWMWSINGTFSVLASFGSVYLAVMFGFNFVLVVGILIYVIGAAFFALKLRD